MIVFSSDKYFQEIYNALKNGGIDVKALVTESPKPKGRGLKLSKNPAHEFADEISLKVLSLDDLKDEDIGFVFAYGKIIPIQIIENFKHSVLNLHPSLLPQYRGATPIQSAILNGDKETGYSIIKINNQVDSGDILYQEKVKISSNDDYLSLREKILKIAIQKLPEIVENYLAGEIKPFAQDEAKVTYCQKIQKADGELNLEMTAVEADQKIRAYSDWPKAFLYLNGKRAILHKAHLLDNKLVIDQIQLEDKKTISFADFKRGYPNLLTFLPNFVKLD